MAKFKKGDTVLDKNGEWFEVKDVRSDGFIAIRMPSGAWEYRDPKEFKFLNSTISTNPVVQNALAAKGVARNGFYKTEEEAEYRAEQFVSAALSRIKGDIDGEIKTVSDCIKLFKGAPMSDKAKSDLERLKAHLAKLNKCKAMF